MPISNYPKGFTNGVTIRGVPITVTHPGEIFWVNSSSALPEGGIAGSNQNDGSYLRPFATILHAHTKVKNGRGDIVMVMPGYTETITEPYSLSSLGVATIGLGRGSLRPKITYETSTGARINLAAKSMLLHNFVLSANFADIVGLIRVFNTDAHIDSCEFVATATNMNWVDCIYSDTTSPVVDGLTVTNCKAFGLDAGNDSFISLALDTDRLHVENNTVIHDHANATAFIEVATGKKLTNAMIKDNNYQSLKTSGDVLVDTDVTTNSGFAINNKASHADTATEVLVDADGLGMFDNTGTGVITASGYPLPAIDS